MSATKQQKTCFVISAIGEPGSEVRDRADKILQFVIEPAAQSAGYVALRADQIASPGIITSQILQHVVDAELAVADLSGMNPNVMYELAIRHAARKPVIQISTEGTRIPFDLAGTRTIFVNISDIHSIKTGRSQVEQAISNLDAEPELANTPLSVALDLQALRERGLQPAGSPRDTDESLFANALKDIEQRLKSIEYRVGRAATPGADRQKYSRRVFLVHGRDGELKNELARFLDQLDFEPVILHEQPDRGQTIFAKLTSEMSDVGFAFVILTPDDVGALATKSRDLKPRPRQNVVFEHGLFAGFLSPKRVCAIRRGNVEIPSDLHGVVYKDIPDGAGVRTIGLDLIYELRAAGYDVDANKLLKHNEKGTKDE